MKEHDSLRRWCAQPQEDDGIDPRRYFSKHSKPANDRKQQQLCRQAYRTLSLVFPGGSPDAVLREVYVAGVSPGPDPSRIVVQLGETRPLSSQERQRVLTGLKGIKGMLRREIAQAITRRRAPDLSFEFMTKPEVTDGSV